MDPALKVISDAAEKDEEYQQIVAALSAGKLTKDLQKGHPGWMLKNQWDIMGFQDQYGLIMYHDLDRTVVFIQNGTLGNFRCKMAFFQRAWQKVKVLHPL